MGAVGPNTLGRKVSTNQFRDGKEYHNIRAGGRLGLAQSKQYRLASCKCHSLFTGKGVTSEKEISVHGNVK